VRSDTVDTRGTRAARAAQARTVRQVSRVSRLEAGEMSGSHSIAGGAAMTTKAELQVRVGRRLAQQAGWFKPIVGSTCARSCCVQRWYFIAHVISFQGRPCTLAGNRKKTTREDSNG
jgi:hypothetical protein